MQSSRQESFDLKLIVVGWDDSERSRGAVRLAGVLGRQFHARVLLVSVVPYRLSPMGVEAYEAYVAEDSERLWHESREALDGLAVDARVQGAGSPARVLHTTAEKEGAGLIIVGSSHRGQTGRVLLGSVSERVMHGAPCPVAITPRDYEERPITALTDIGVGYDASPSAEAAVSTAISMAAATDAHLHVASVLEPFMFDPFPDDFHALLESDDANETAKQLLDKRLSDLRDRIPPQIRADVQMSEGDPVEVLTKRSRELDLLVVGSRDYGPLARTLVGSVSTQLLRSAASPVLVVPRPEG